MATHQAIAAVSAALRALLADAAQEVGGAECRLLDAAELRSPLPDGVGVFLYRVAPNAAARNVTPRGRPGLPLDLHYLVIASAADPLRQQTLLEWAISVIERSPVLNATGSDERVDLAMEALTLADEAAIWQAAAAPRKTSVSYLARIRLK